MTKYELKMTTAEGPAFCIAASNAGMSCSSQQSIVCRRNTMGTGITDAPYIPDGSPRTEMSLAKLCSIERVKIHSTVTHAYNNVDRSSVVGLSGDAKLEDRGPFSSNNSIHLTVSLNEW